MQLPQINETGYVLRCYTGHWHIRSGRISEIIAQPDGSLSVCIFGVCRGRWGEKVFPTFQEAAQALEERRILREN